jgi:hypothetical protein
MTKRKRRKRSAQRNRQKPVSPPTPPQEDATDFVAVPMVLFVQAFAGTHQAAAMLQRPLSAQARLTILEMLEDGTGEMISVADRLVSASDYFRYDVPTTHARLLLEQLDAEEEPNFLISLESEPADTGMAEGGVVAAQALWLLSMLFVMPEADVDDWSIMYEMPEADAGKIQQILEAELGTTGLAQPDCYPWFSHESGIAEEWQELLNALSQGLAEAGVGFEVGEHEQEALDEAIALSDFARVFPLNIVDTDRLLEKGPTFKISLYPYFDYLAVYNLKDDAEGKRSYGMYLGSRALQLSLLQVAARRKNQDIVLTDVLVAAEDLFDWLDAEGLENTPVNRARFVQMKPTDEENGLGQD